jgi:hypothetical protein
LRLCVPQPATVRYGINGWTKVADVAAVDGGLDLYVADLPVEELHPGDRIDFTFLWSTSSQWEGHDYRVAII